MSQDRYNGLDKRYQKYWRTVRLGQFILLGAFSVFFLLIPILTWFVLPDIPQMIRGYVVTASYVIAVLLILLAARTQANALKFLPSVEDRVYYFLASALSDLNLFASSGAALEKESAVKSLRYAANAIDSWYWGNLKFLEPLGKSIVRFRTNFRGRLIPAITRADSKKLQEFFLSLTGFVNTLGLSQLNEAKIGLWNQWLERKSSSDPSIEVFPYEKPRPGRFKRLASKRLHLSVGVSVLLAPLAAGLIGVYALQIPVEAAYQDAAIVFSGMIVLLVYLIFGRQKSS